MFRDGNSRSHPKAMPQQPLRCGAVVRLNAGPGTRREAAMLVGQHLFRVTSLQQAPSDEGARDASAKICQHPAARLAHRHRHKRRSRQLPPETPRRPRKPGTAHERSGWSRNQVTEPTKLYSSHVETNSVDEGDCANVQGRFFYLHRTGAVGLQAPNNDPQEDSQHQIRHRPVALHETAQPLRNRQHPLACRQAQGAAGRCML